MLSNLFRRAEMIPVASQVPQKDIWEGFPSLALTEAGVTGSFLRLEKWSRDFPLQEFMVGAEIYLSCVGGSCQAGCRAGVHCKSRWGTGSSFQQCWVRRKAAGGNTCSALRALLRAKTHGAVSAFAMPLVDAVYSQTLLSGLDLILGGIERKYLGKDCMRRRHINLSSWLNFVIFTNVEHIWSGIPLICLLLLCPVFAEAFQT